MEKSVELEQQYGELFDRLIVNYELEHVYEDILKLASTLETEPQWIPRKWLEFPS